MMKKEKITKVIVNSVLLAAIVALGITVYQAGSSQNEYEDVQEPVQLVELEEEEKPSVDAGTSLVEAKLDTKAKDTEKKEDTQNASEELPNMETANNSEYVEELGLTDSDAETVSNSSVEAQMNMVPLDFTENTLMEWPVEGSLLMDYNMEQTVYFKTLNQYKVNPAIAVQAAEGTEIRAAVTGTITSIQEDAQTGTTITMDLGNGYEAIYGQLKDVTVSQGQTVQTDTLLGTVAAPTKYYALEGSNLYFAMRKDGTPIDPLTYLP
ncbi:MAG: M23 family metallopeptidase [Eubacteriales bacterium]|nr:M23 family metallopeptidase [Eubacteriales bacterium]